MSGSKTTNIIASHHQTSDLRLLILSTSNQLLEKRLLRFLFLGSLLILRIEAVLPVDVVHRGACIEADGLEATGGVLEAV